MTVNINIDNKTIVRILVVVVLVVAGFSFLSATRNVFILLVASGFLAVALNPPVSYLSSKITGGSRGLATGIAYLTVVSIIAVFLWAIVPPMVTQTRDFLNDLPDYIADLGEGDDAVANFIRENDVEREIQNFTDSVSDGTVLGNTSSQLFSGLGRVTSSIISVLTVLVLTFFMLIEGPGWLEKIWEAQPEDKREHRRALGKKMYLIITSYVNGQLLIALLSATSALVAMLIAGIPLAVPLAGLVGLLGLIPLVGATLGAVIVVIIALFQSFYTALGMAIFFIVYQQVENNAVQPLIQSRQLEVSPLLIFVAVLFGISLGGLLGGFVAIPAAAIARLLFLDYLDQRKSKKKSSKNPLKKIRHKEA